MQRFTLVSRPALLPARALSSAVTGAALTVVAASEALPADSFRPKSALSEASFRLAGARVATLLSGGLAMPRSQRK